MRTGALVVAVTSSKRTSRFVSTLYSLLRHNIDGQVLYALIAISDLLPPVIHIIC